jgi:signal transduction histidine kinase
MLRATDLAVKVRGQLLARRWLIVALAALLATIVEVGEHQLGGLRDLDPDFVREILLFGVLGPLTIGIILTLLATTTSERIQAIRRLSQQRSLSQQLASFQGWNDLITFVAQYPHVLVSAVQTCLLVADQELGGFEAVAEWRHPDESPTDLDSLRTSGQCRACASAQGAAAAGLYRCRCGETSGPRQASSRYCLPLEYGASTIGLLSLQFPSGVSPSADQIDVLNGIAPTLALAIHDARPERSAAIRAEATEAERKRIAQDLHDTLGQSLGYLHFKLDQLSGDGVLREIGAIRQELERMRDVANESYEQVRSTLTDLQAPPSTDLATCLLKRAQSAADRVGFEVQLASQGQPWTLPLQVQRQILYLFREALSNVEKHADARHVDINLVWVADSLEIRLCDDGRGFEPTVARANGHFGLSIMHERAQAVGGELRLISSPGSGTQVAFTLPVAHANQRSQGGAE